MHRTRLPIALSIVLACVLSGCSAPLFAGLTIGEIGLAGSLISTAATGKGLGDHAMDAATGRDCRILEGLAREDRKVCERDNSPATGSDWKGLASVGNDSADPSSLPGADQPPRDGRDS